MGTLNSAFRIPNSPFRRVVVTGMGSVSPFGRGVDALMDGLRQGRSGVRRVEGIESVKGLRSLIAATAPGIDGKEIPRKFRRSMSRMAIYATLASQEAAAAANVTAETMGSGRMGIAIGSTIGSPHTLEAFFGEYLRERSIEQMKSTVFFQIMSHSCAANVAQAMGITGRIIAPSAACATGCQSIGFAYEMIASGVQDMMLCGGADELHPLTVATFDIINAASTGYNDRPDMTPRPFDKDRDGVVCGEGSGVLLLEALESAIRRNAAIYAEVAGFGTLSDPSSIANPDPVSILRCMELALLNAGLKKGEVDYVNAHATGTEQGDIAESQAIAELLGDSVPVSSLKGHLGHTMAASGALELVATIGMMKDDSIIPTRNLETVDERCAAIRHVQESEDKRLFAVLKNNFALGGVNASIVLRRYENDR